MTDDTEPTETEPPTDSGESAETDAGEPAATDSGEPAATEAGKSAATDSGEPTEGTATAEDVEDDEDDVDVVGIVVRAVRVTVAFLTVVARVTFVALAFLLSFVRDSDDHDPFHSWLLLEGNRWTIIGTLTLSFFLGALLLGTSNVIGVQESSFVTTMFSTIIAGLFSFVPIVVTVNSLAMTGLSSSLEGIRERIESVARFRGEIAAMTDEVAVTPTTPAGFLAVVTDIMLDRADAVEAAIAAADVSDAAERDVGTLLSVVRGVARDIRDELDGSNPAVFVLLLPMMDDAYSQHINRARQVTLVHDELPEEAVDGLSDLKEIFTSLDVIRQYFKTMYLQQELARLSRLITYSGIVAFLSSVLVIMIYASGFPPVQHQSPLLLLVTVGLATAFLPFAILFAYILRIATVIKRTSAPGAFTPPGERPAYADE